MSNKKYFAKMSSKGQLTIPSTIRDILNISDGDSVEFEIIDNTDVVIRKKKNSCKLCDGTGKIEDKVCFGCDGTGEWNSLEDISKNLIWNCSKYGIGINIINTVMENNNLKFLKIPDISVNYNKFNYPEEILNECIDTLIILNLSHRNMKIINAKSYKDLDENTVLLNDLLKKIKSKKMIEALNEKFNPFLKVFNEFFKN